MYTHEIELKGHLIDSLILPKIWDIIVRMGGEFENLDLKVGKTNRDYSVCRMIVKADSHEKLDKILDRLVGLGAIISTAPVKLKEAPSDCVLPDDFYSTTNHETHIKVKDRWLLVESQKMDSVIVVDPSLTKAACRKICEVRKGNIVVTGTNGIRVKPPEKPRERSRLFGFMESSISSERPLKAYVEAVAREIQSIKKHGGKIAVVAGPAVIHAGGQEALAGLIRKGYIDILLSGNALAVHDIETALLGTSLGMKQGTPVEGGHRHHMLAINEIMKAGGIRNAVEKGKLKKGIMYECIKKNVKFVLAGSIRDDGPLPEVITDMRLAQKEIGKAVEDVELVLMLSTMLHSIAVGNMLQSKVKTICVDINPQVCVKLADRGTSQAVGIVNDVGQFLERLSALLK